MRPRGFRKTVGCGAGASGCPDPAQASGADSHVVAGDPQTPRCRSNSAPIDVGVVLPESSADDFAEAITTHVPISAPRGGPSPRTGRADVEWSASCPTSNSFVPGTKVVMADGSSKPIEEVELGDYVLATDPETGQTVSRKVVATVTGEGKRGWSRSPSTSMVRLVRRQR